jgi:hypothetical protein
VLLLQVIDHRRRDLSYLSIFSFDCVHPKYLLASCEFRYNWYLCAIFIYSFSKKYQCLINIELGIY